MYSTVTGSSTVSRWLWHSTRALLMTIRASAVRPETRAEALSGQLVTTREYKDGTPASASFPRSKYMNNLESSYPVPHFVSGNKTSQAGSAESGNRHPWGASSKEGPLSPSNCCLLMSKSLSFQGSPLTSLHVSQLPSSTNWSPGLPLPPRSNLYLQRPCRHCHPKRRSSGLFFHLVVWPLIFFPHQEQQCPFLVHQP